MLRGPGCPCSHRPARAASSPAATHRPCSGAAPLAALALAPRLEPPSDRSAGRTRSGQLGSSPPAKKGQERPCGTGPGRAPEKGTARSSPAAAHSPCCATPVSAAWPPWGHETAGRAGCGAGTSESNRSHRFGTQPEHEQGHGVGSPCVPCCPQEPCVCPLRGHRGVDRGRVSLCCPQMQELQHCPELLACRLE